MHKSSLFLASALALTVQGDLVLLQQQATAGTAHVWWQSAAGKGGKSDSGVGQTAPITERGYQRVAATKDNEEMKAFAVRVAEQEARFITDPGELSGMAPYYSGVNSVQNLQALQAELHRVPWVADGLGRTAPLNEEGYQQVAAMKNRKHMVAFSQRILENNGKKCTDRGALDWLMPHYDGEIAFESFWQLKRELVSAPWAHNTGGVALSQSAAVITPSEPHAAEARPKSELQTSQQTIQAEDEQESCQPWCAGTILVDHAGSTKSLSSWATKCTFFQCFGCSSCASPQADVVDAQGFTAVSAAAESTCEDWCQSNSFRTMKPDDTTVREFAPAWNKKCGWPNCAACSDCADVSLF